MKKCFSALVILTCVLALFVSPTMAAKGTIGYVVPYKVGYFSSFVNSFESVAKAEGYKTIQLHHEYNAAKENKAIEDLITMGVDAIHVVSVSPASAEYSCRLANEAGIPIQVSDSGILEAKGKPFANIDFDWIDLYGTVARSIRKEVDGDLQVVWIQGFLGTPPVIMGIEGFKGALKDLEGIKLATDIQDHIRKRMPEWKRRYPGVEALQVAVMGCIVNGPGESKHADIGISLPGTGEAPSAPVFVDGKKVATLRGEGLAKDFTAMVEDYVEKRFG